MIRSMLTLTAGLVTVLVVGSSAPAGADLSRFADVRGGEYYGAPVAWMAAQGITTGVGGSDRFMPRELTTRAEVATFLWRIEGRPGGYPPHGFTDVSPGTFYESALEWLRAEGHTTGVGGSDRFEPDRHLTRAEMATLLWRIEGRPGGYPPHGFADVPPGTFYESALEWLRAEGHTTGVGGSDRFEPDGSTDRAQVSTFLWRHGGRPAPPNPGDAVSCGDFATQPEAQGWYDLYHRYHGDVAGLDGGDGVACPGLPGDQDLPVLSPDELRRFGLAVEPLPGTRALTTPPPILGHGAADDRIRAIAEARGYRLQAEPALPLAHHEGVPMLPESADALRDLFGSVRGQGMTIGATSGYRSVDRQRSIFTQRLDAAGRSRIGRPFTTSEIADGRADAAIDSVLRFHSIPGYSKHHTGRTADLHAGGSLAQFEGTPAERWLRDDGFRNALHLGWVPSYPRGAAAQGPEPEPWEYVHVGVERVRCAGWYVDLADPLARSACPAGPPPRS